MSTMLPGRVVQMADKAMEMMGVSPKAEQAANTSTTKYKEDPSGSKMTALHWHGNKSVSIADCPKPAVTDDKDVIVKITSTAICGSDLHLFLGAVPGMRNGQVLGHEPMGIVESVGPAVRNIKPGDRVVVAFCLACGECAFCMAQLYSSCDCTNPSITEEKMMGARTSGLLGHPELMGGYAGGQAEYLRVPFGEVNCLVIPPETNLPDDKVLFLSDILSTAWHGTELAFVGQGDVVAIWGCGPVGILTAQCAFARGAKRVIIVDSVAYRLEFAKKVLPRIETVDFSSDKTSSAGEKTVLELCQNEPFGAPDCCIECVGMHYAHSAVHRVEMAVGMETDSPEALNACILACRKGGRIGLIGAYAGLSNHVMIGAFMEKCLSMRSGQTPVHKYWKDLLEKIKNGTLDPSVVITHHLPLRDAAKGYQIFNDKMDNVIKIVLRPDDSAATA